MAGQTTSTISTSTALREKRHGELVDSVFRNSDFLPLFRRVKSGGGSTYDVTIVIAANGSAQVYTEGQAAPSAGYQQTVKAAWPYKHIRVFTQMSGHLRRNLGAQWPRGGSWPMAEGGQDFDFELAKQDLADLANTTFMANATYGIVGIVDDSTTNYADLSRTTYTTLVSKIVAGGSANLTAALLDKLLFQTYDAEQGGRVELLMMSPTQARKYSSIVHGKLALDGRQDPAGASIDSLPPYGGVRAVMVRDLTNSVVLGLSGMNTDWAFIDHEPAGGGIDVLPYGVTSDAKTDQISMAGALVCLRPQRQGKIESLNAT